MATVGSVSNVVLGLLYESNQDDYRTLYVEWKWSQSHTDHYEITWFEYVNTKWLQKSTSNVAAGSLLNDTYTPGNSATQVYATILPVAQTNDKNKPYWTAAKAKTATYVLGNVKIENKGTVSDIAIKHVSNSSSDLLVTWKWPESHTDHYEVKWQWNNGSIWMKEDKQTVSVKQFTHGVDGGAKKIRVCIRPVAKTEPKSGIEAPFWKATWSDWVVYKIEVPEPTKVKGVTNVKLALQTKTDRALTLSWDWEREHTDSYTIKWFEKVNKVWYNGSTNTVEAGSKKNNVYTPSSDKATKVKAKIQPVSTTHNVNGTDVYYWIADWVESEVFTYGTKDKPPDEGTVSDLKIAIQNGTTRTMYASWTWDKDHTDHYEVEWEYTSNDGIWWPGSSGSETTTKPTYGAPDIADQVRVRVKPVSKTHIVNTEEVAWWTANWSEHVVFALKAQPVPTVESVTNLTVGIQAGTDRTMYASWEWTKENTDNYTYQWSYTTSDGRWYNEQETTTTEKQCLYSAPANATSVKVWVRPNAITHNENGQNVAYWNAPSCESVTHQFEAGTVPDLGTVSSVHVGIQSGTERTVYATWEWGQEHTESYSVEWTYETGDGIWWNPGETSTTITQCTYDAPSNAYKVKLRIRPNSETHMVNGVETTYWSADWCSDVIFSLEAEPPPDAGTVSNVVIGIQSGTDRTVYAVWDWGQEHTESYSVEWSYDTGNGIWFVEDESTVKLPQCIYSVPSNAVRIKIRVRPNSETHYQNGVSVAYWSSDWSSEVTYEFADTAAVPSAPSVTISQYTLTAEVNTSDIKTYEIEFQVVRDNKEVFSSGKAKVTMGYASYSCSVNAGSMYKVRCRALTSSGDYTEWSDYSEQKGTIPSTPSSITSCRALTQKSVELTWTPVTNVTSYEIQYTTNKLYFDSSDDVQNMSVDFPSQKAIVTGLSAGEEWFFRLRAVNSNGSSGWTSFVSVVLGKVPEAPTTWAQTTTVIVGEDAILYWVHNAEDGSRQTSAEIELTINGQTRTETVKFSASDYDDEETEETSSYTIKTGSYTEGTVIRWRVRTKGIMDEYSPWSILRIIDVYAPPTLVLYLSRENKWYWDPFNFNTDNVLTAYGEGGEWNSVLGSFPYYITATPGPATQKPVGYYLTITSEESYRTVNQMGETVLVGKGEEVYSKYFDAVKDHLFVTLTPSDINVENNIIYKVHCLVYMDSGLTAEAEETMYVNLVEERHIPDAEIALDKEAVMTYICPYCEDANGSLVSDVLLSVYRREFDGSYVELAKDIANNRSTYITDPHPALDYARYRIVATSTETGSIGYYDLPGYPVHEIAAILQWNEDWSSFEGDGESPLEAPPWTGTMLKLPYNIDVADDHEMDVSLVKYIGRSHPVSYYGTQLGSTSTWNVDIVKGDEETLYQLRRLMRYTGDVYVREPSGSGYWANVKVSFSQKHCEVTIPVTLNITRVDGGA